MPGPLLLGGTYAGAAAPKERVLACQRGRHHALTDRFKDVGLSEIGNQKTEGLPAGHARAGGECARAGSPFYESGSLKIAHCPGHRDPRYAEGLHALRLGRHTGAVFPASALKLTAARRIDGGVLAGAVCSHNFICFVASLPRYPR